MHFGIKGMKWGVRRFQNADGSLKPAGEKRYGISEDGVKKAYNIASKTYSVAKKYGANVLDKQAQRNDFRSQYHESKGHKLRSKYYDRQAYKSRDKQFDDKELISATIKDVSIKSAAVIGAAKVGASVVQGLINANKDRLDRIDFRKANEELLKIYNNR